MSTSIDTKNKLAQAFGQLAMAQTIEKISISEITKNCNCNRQTFYYHFTNKQELLSYFFEKETFDCLLEKNVTKKTWVPILSGFLSEISLKKEMYFNFLNFERTTFQNYFHHYFKNFLVTLFSESRLIHNFEISYGEFLSYGFCGIVIDWILDRCNQEVEFLTNHFVNLVRDIQNKIVSSS